MWTNPGSDKSPCCYLVPLLLRLGVKLLISPLFLLFLLALSTHYCDYSDSGVQEM